MTQPDTRTNSKIQSDQKKAKEGLLKIQSELGIKNLSLGLSEPPDETTIPETTVPSIVDESIALSKKESSAIIAERKSELERQQKEARDRRSQLLKAVRASAPTINKPLVETFERLSLEKHEFAQKALVRLFENDAQLQKSLDFFDLNLAQREDLLDRIGFYKGIVIDHSLSNPVETGFREVLRRDSPENEKPGPPRNAPATLLYRKPNFSGYHENYFTTSESLHQVQKNGVTDIKSSLTAAGGKAVTAGVSAAGAYYNAEGSNEGGNRKKIYITANFFLPKVELSFDDSVPCASDEFEAACLNALAEPSEEKQFSTLITVLGKFGQFVPTQTLVGGRLYATDIKEFDGKESESEVVNRYAGQIKVSAESATASFESDTSIEKSKQQDEREKEKRERQTYTIHAVGGEGAVVEQAGRWAESLYDYQRWSAVQREKLIPSVDLLSKDLRTRVWDVLKSFTRQNSALHLLGEYKAYFLFYGDYDVRVGKLAKPDMVILRNLNTQDCLAIQGESPQNGQITGKPFDWSRQVLWRITPNGNILSSVPVSTGFPGKKKTVDFALTVLDELPQGHAATSATLSVGMRELGSSKKQVWEFTGGGEIWNVATGEEHVLCMPLNDTPVLKPRTNKVDNSNVWSIQEATSEDIAIMESRKTYGRLAHPSGLVVAIDGYEDSSNSFSLSDKRRLLLQRFNGSKHQLWHTQPDGSLVSAIQIGSKTSALITDVHLVHSVDNSMTAQAKSFGSTVFKCDKNGVVHAVDGAGKIYYAGAEAEDNMAGKRVTSVTDEKIAVKFEPLPENSKPSAYSVSHLQKPGEKCRRLKTVDKRELIVDGYLTGMEFIVEKRGQERSAWFEYSRLRMRLTVVSKTSPPIVEFKDEPDKDDEDRDFLCDDDGISNVYVDDRFLLLPEEPIHAIRLRVHKDKVERLAFEYRQTRTGPWIGLSGSNENARKLNVDRIGTYTGADENTLNGTKVLGIALEYNEATQVIRPKLLRRLIG